MVICLVCDGAIIIRLLCDGAIVKVYQMTGQSEGTLGYDESNIAYAFLTC